MNIYRFTSTTGNALSLPADEWDPIDAMDYADRMGFDSDSITETVQ